MLRVYLGAAPGVGKTYKMLNEGWRRTQRGTDVVIGWVDTHGRPGTKAQIRDMEIIPPKIMHYRQQEFYEMDTAAIIARRPAVALVDEFAHSNVGGSKNEKRWQDIGEILDAGIDVITTINIQHLESLSDVVAAITGIIQHETVPDVLVRKADQIEFVDMTPEALQRRLAHGDVYPKERIDMALTNYFRLGNLVALRELGLLWMADNVDEQLQSYRTRHGIDSPWETKERILVGLTGIGDGEHLIRRAARMARRTKGDLIGVHIITDDYPSKRQDMHLGEMRDLLEQLGGIYKEVIGVEIADSLIEVAKLENITQIVIGSSHKPKWQKLLNGSIVNEIIDKSGDMIDVHVISHSNTRKHKDTIPTPKHHLSILQHFINRIKKVRMVGRRQQLQGLLFLIIVLPLLTIILVTLRNQFTVGAVSLIYIVPVVIATAIGGALPGLLSGFIGFFLLNWYFTPPIGTFSIASGRDITALTIFIFTAIIINILVAKAAKKSNEALRIRSHAAALSRATTALLNEDDPLPILIQEIERSFLLDGLSIIEDSGGGGNKILASSGYNPPSKLEEATFAFPISDTKTIFLKCAEFNSQDKEILEIFINQIKMTLSNKELFAKAQESVALSKANETRTALLAAVSHDLRTPLASIKAASTGYLSSEPILDEEEKRVLVATIDEEADRLNTLVNNLLDMSRIYTQSVKLHVSNVTLYEVVSSAIISLGLKETQFEIYVAESLPQLATDSFLLERALANIISNAVNISDKNQTIKIVADVISEEWIEIRIIDHGPGIPQAYKDQIFLPFQRLGDNISTKGVGLGLAVAKGFINTLNGIIDVEDTPGGGTTMVIRLRYSLNLAAK